MMGFCVIFRWYCIVFKWFGAVWSVLGWFGAVWGGLESFNGPQQKGSTWKIQERRWYL